MNVEPPVALLQRMNIAPRRVLITALLVGALVTSGCRPDGTGAKDPADAPPAVSSSSTDTVKTSVLDENPVRFQLVDVAEERGLDRILQSGSAEKLLILENVGTGCAFLDADGDGQLDIFLANAGTIAGSETVPGPGSAFYRRTATRVFEDRTQASGLSFRGWGTGVPQEIDERQFV